VCVDEEDGVDAFDAAGGYALREATKFVGAGNEPIVLVVVIGDEMAVFELTAGFVVGDGKAVV